MKLLTVPAWHPEQWVVPVTKPLMMPCPCFCDMGFVPFHGRIAIATRCRFCLGIGVDVDQQNGYGDRCAHCNGLGHLIVASAVVDDCLVVDSQWDELPPTSASLTVYSDRHAVVWKDGGNESVDVTDQLAYATFTPGQHALILSDVYPVCLRSPIDWRPAFLPVGTSIPVESSGEWTEWVPK